MHKGHLSRSGSCESLPLGGITVVLRTNTSFTPISRCYRIGVYIFMFVVMRKYKVPFKAIGMTTSVSNKNETKTGLNVSVEMYLTQL
jgi:hypothetical protein